MNFEKRTQSKAFMFFDRLFRLFICNVFVVISMCIPVGILLWVLIALGNGGSIEVVMPLFWIAIASFLVCFPFLILPSIVSTTEVIAGNGTGTVFKEWFTSFAKHYIISMLFGLIFSVVMGLITFAIYFYSNAEIIETGIKIGNFTFSANMQRIVMQAGFIVMLIIGIIMILLSVHVPLLIITFPKFKLSDLIKTDLFVTINNFLSTFTLLTMLLMSIILFALFPIWILFGISLPIMIGVRLTKVAYVQLGKIDFDKINKILDEEDQEEKIG